MKKNYITPIVRNIQLDAESMLAGSPVIEQKDGEIDNPGDVMSNQRTPSSLIWGDE